MTVVSPSASRILPLRIKIPEIVVTNTLIITNIDRGIFLPENLAELRDRLEQYGKLYKIIPIKSFNRILAIFYQTTDAKIAKTYCDRVKILNKNIRIYYGQNTPIYDGINNTNHLNVPKLERNLIVSPPCSSECRPYTSLNISGSNTNRYITDVSDRGINNDIPKIQISVPTAVPCDIDSLQSDVEVPPILIQDWDDSRSHDN